MNENWNPEIPLDLQQNFKKEKEQAFTLYLDFVVDAASIYHRISGSILCGRPFFRMFIKV